MEVLVGLSLGWSLLVFLAWIVLAFLVGHLAGEKGRSKTAWTLLALLVSPVIVVLFLLVAGPNPAGPHQTGGWRTVANEFESLPEAPQPKPTDSRDSRFDPFA